MITARNVLRTFALAAVLAMGCARRIAIPVASHPPQVARTNPAPRSSAETDPYTIDRIVMVTPNIGWATAGRPRDSVKRPYSQADLREDGISDNCATVILRTVDGCRHWKEVSTSTECSSPEVGLHVFDAFHAVTVVRLNNKLSIAETINSGKTWKSKIVAGPSGEFKLFVSFGYRGFGAILACSGYAMGSMEKWLYVTKNGGATWKLTAVTDPPTKNLGTLNFSGGANEFKVYGHTIWLSTSGQEWGTDWTTSNDNGKTWKSIHYARLPSYWSVNRAPLPSFENANAKRATIWVTAWRRLMNIDHVKMFTVTTKEHGKTFSTAATPSILSNGWIGVFVNDRRGFLIDVHGSKVFVTVDAGKTVQHIALNPPLWKASDEPNVNLISDKKGNAFLRVRQVNNCRIYHLNEHGQPKLIYAGGFQADKTEEARQQIIRQNMEAEKRSMLPK